MGFIKDLFGNFMKLSRPVFSFVDNQLQFKINSDFFFKYTLEDYDVKTRHDPYIFEAYTLHNEDIFLEYIKDDFNTNWNGQALSLYEGFFKEKLRIYSWEVLESIDIDPYTFKTIKINNNFVLHIVYVYDISTNVIIIDTKGDLYKNLHVCLNANYEYKFANDLKGEINFNISLVKENSIKGFINANDN